MSGYEFADPSIVRAYYDPSRPLAERDMLLELQALRFLRLYVGVRVGEVYERGQDVGGRQAHVWGWNYRTLEGHVEMGQMDWEVWKWLDTGEVEFRVHALSRPAPIRNPIIRIGFHLLRGRERAAFLESTRTRMRTLVEVSLENGGHPEVLRRVAAQSTPPARRGPETSPTTSWRAERPERERNLESMPRPIFQFPNPPLIAAASAAVLARATSGQTSRAAAVASEVALAVWSYEEIVDGANWFRRLLGASGAAAAAAGLARSTGALR